MPRGIKGSGPVAEAMSKEELDMIEQRTQGQRAPLHEDDHPLPKARVVETADGRKISQVGNFMAAPVFGDAQTLKRFARIKADTTGWTKMSNDEALLYQDLRVLAGHDPDKRLGLLDHRKLDQLKKDAKNGLLTEREEGLLAQLEDLK